MKKYREILEKLGERFWKKDYIVRMRPWIMVKGINLNFVKEYVNALIQGFIKKIYFELNYNYFLLLLIIKFVI